MKPLHTSYSNVGNWKFIVDDRTKDLTVIYNSKTAIISAIIICFLCVGLGFLGSQLAEKEGATLFLIIGIGTAILLGAIFFGVAISENSKGPILTYNKSSDSLKIRDLKMTVSEASKNVAFSCERYRNHDDGENGRYRCEFNILIDGERKKFLSHVNREGFSPMIQFAVKAGIRVHHHTIENKT